MKLIMIFSVTLFWACQQLVHDFTVSVYANLLYGNFQTYRVFRGVFKVKFESLRRFLAPENPLKMVKMLFFSP